MDYVGYAGRAAALLNSPLTHSDDLLALPVDGPRPGAEDLPVLAALRRDLLVVVTLAQNEDLDRAADALNDLLVAHRVVPQVQLGDPTGRFTPSGATAAELLTGQVLLGLASLLLRPGRPRFGFCHGEGCTNVWVDTSPGATRRFCSTRCSTRLHVAAHRARTRSTRKAPR